MTNLDPAGAEPDTFTRTVVRMDSSGTHVTTDNITRDQQLDEIQQREDMLTNRNSTGVAEQAITVDGSCAASDMWLFNQANLIGNEICFFGAGDANLSNYSLVLCTTTTCFILNWRDAVASYWAGTESGYFFLSSSSLTLMEPFTPFERVDNYVDGKFATDLVLTN